MVNLSSRRSWKPVAGPSLFQHDPERAWIYPLAWFGVPENVEKAWKGSKVNATRKGFLWNRWILQILFFLKAICKVLFVLFFETFLRLSSQLSARHWWHIWLLPLSWAAGWRVPGCWEDAEHWRRGGVWLSYPDVGGVLVMLDLTCLGLLVFCCLKPSNILSKKKGCNWRVAFRMIDLRLIGHFHVILGDPNRSKMSCVPGWVLFGTLSRLPRDQRLDNAYNGHKSLPWLARLCHKTTADKPPRTQVKNLFLLKVKSVVLPSFWSCYIICTVSAGRRSPCESVDVCSWIGDMSWNVMIEWYEIVMIEWM